MSVRRKVMYVHSDKLLEEADKNPAVMGRALLTHALIESYNLLPDMEIITPKVCNAADLRSFHTRDYVEHLQQCGRESEIDSNGSSSKSKTNELFGLAYDCSTWFGMQQYVCCIAGATMSACEAMTVNNSPLVVINWTGGWHHAQRGCAAGFCYVNDIVLGIMVLRTRFERVLYIDVDVHHGDAVQKAFASSRNVFTLSFHQFECGYYPGSGTVTECGVGRGKGYAANFPYKRGIKGDTFCKYFKQISALVIECYQPDVCIVQCGADVLVGDPLGGTNLTPNDIALCLRGMLEYNISMLLLGGGGYHFVNASRLWTLLTAEVCAKFIEDDIPSQNEQFLAYGPDFCLHIEPQKNLPDINKEDDLDDVVKCIKRNLLEYQVGVKNNNQESVV